MRSNFRVASTFKFIAAVFSCLVAGRCDAEFQRGRVRVVRVRSAAADGGVRVRYDDDAFGCPPRFIPGPVSPPVVLNRLIADVCPSSFDDASSVVDLMVFYDGDIRPMADAPLRYGESSANYEGSVVLFLHGGETLVPPMVVHKLVSREEAKALMIGPCVSEAAVMPSWGMLSRRFPYPANGRYPLWRESAAL